MERHDFIFNSVQWLGEGKIQLNMVDEDLDFYTRWDLTPINSSGKIIGEQEIQIKGLSEVMHNQFVFSEIAAGKFVVELENQALGKVIGHGLIDENVIAWEFRLKDIGFEGYEFYEKQEDGSYQMRAEYATSDQLRTTIQGKVWVKTAQTKAKKTKKQKSDEKS